MTHGNEATFPRLADHLGWFPAELLIPVVEGVVTAFRDHGDRTNRRRARLKYVLHDRGADWFRAEVESRTGIRFEDRELPAWSTPSYLGWQEASDGTWSLGFHTLSGRVQGPLKAALRQVVTEVAAEVQLTPEQDLLLLGIEADQREAVEAGFRAHGIAIPKPEALASRALACVALPWCGLAVAEAERALPEMLTAFQRSLDRHGKSRLAPTFRVTGCANGCARPYASEVALVGQTPDRYVLWAGGDAEGTRLAFPVAEKVASAELPALFDRLVAVWAAEGHDGERFGDFAQRMRPAALAEALASAPVEP
jgi:sulfite reductase beta subunit-like hemoprotein